MASTVKYDRNVGNISTFECGSAGGLLYLVVNPDGILQEPVLLLLHPVCLKWLLADFTRLQEEKDKICKSQLYLLLMKHGIRIFRLLHSSITALGEAQ